MLQIADYTTKAAMGTAATVEENEAAKGLPLEELPDEEHSSVWTQATKSARWVGETWNVR